MANHADALGVIFNFLPSRRDVLYVHKIFLDPIFRYWDVVKLATFQACFRQRI